jgi:hypothetical protein
MRVKCREVSGMRVTRIRVARGSWLGKGTITKSITVTIGLVPLSLEGRGTGEGE